MGLIALAVALPTALTVQPVTELLGRAILPAEVFAAGPTSGRFLNLNSDGKVGTATTFNGIAFPFKDPPVQGFSAVLAGPKAGTYLVMSDNGYGGKANSGDALLRFYAVEPDFNTGRVYPVDRQTGKRLTKFSREIFCQLNDRNQKLKGIQLIVADLDTYPGSEQIQKGGIPVDRSIQQNRLLTGFDFDPESFRRAADGTYWMGDEFGPFLLHFDANGTLLEAPIPTPNPLDRIDRKSFVRTPDHPAFAPLSEAEKQKVANLPRSKGFEGMALSADGTKLYPMLEGALLSDPNRRRLFIMEFDLRQRQYTRRTYAYRLEEPNYAIGELSAISNTEFLVIERDNGTGIAGDSAFPNPARFKKIYKINLQQQDAEGFVAKTAIADLLNIADPKKLGGDGVVNDVFTFPFVTIESVLPLDPRTLVVVNDNNFPFSAGRTPGKSDNSEFIKIRLSQPLNLRLSRIVNHREDEH